MSATERDRQEEAEQHLSVALGGNMNVTTLTPFAIAELMAKYANACTAPLEARIAELEVVAQRFKAYLGNLDCECDTYMGFTCSLHADKELVNQALAGGGA